MPRHLIGSLPESHSLRCPAVDEGDEGRHDQNAQAGNSDLIAPRRGWRVGKPPQQYSKNNPKNHKHCRNPKVKEQVILGDERMI